MCKVEPSIHHITTILCIVISQVIDSHSPLYYSCVCHNKYIIAIIL